jgi:DNA-binding LacI/PurR family transcriptional regulator
LVIALNRNALAYRSAQVMQLIRQEIRRGRWAAGERLPSIAQLVRESGLNRRVVQYAIAKLVDEGRLQHSNYRGVCVAKPTQSNTGRRVLGVLMPVFEEYYPATHSWLERQYLHQLTEVAQRRGYSVEVQMARQAQEPESIFTPQGPFGDRVQGIISFHTHSRPFQEELATGQIPVVFWRDYSWPDCYPFVLHDHRTGFYLMTRQLIAAGHRHILMIPQLDYMRFSAQQGPHPDDADDSFREGRDRYQGFIQAMQEAGLPMDYAAMDTPVNDVPSLQELLATHPQVTALVYFSGNAAPKLLMMLEVLGVPVPRGVTIVAPTLEGTPDSATERDIGGVHYNAGHGANLCLDILEDQMATRRINCSRVRLAPHFKPGNTFAAPRAAGIDLKGVYSADITRSS